MNILIVEDNEETLSFLKQTLKEEGFVTDTAKDGQLGLEKALHNDYDILILDNILPHRTGPEICEEVRKKGKNVRILMLSVNSEPDIKAKALNLGADDYLSKPFSVNELMARLRALLRRPEETKKEIIKTSSLSMNLKNHTVRRAGKEIYFTPREFALLEYFMRNRGRIISRVEILEHVWDMNANLFTNTVEMHILNIRKKLGGHGKNCPIHTVAGAGYKMI
jgi:DNA-binding response OmpR family regulator